MDNGDVAKHMQ